jgi:hypothetical protein
MPPGDLMSTTTFVVTSTASATVTHADGTTDTDTTEEQS